MRGAVDRSKAERPWPFPVAAWWLALVLSLGLLAWPGAVGAEGDHGPIRYVAGGVEAHEWPEVAVLISDVGICGATFVGCRTLVTAAHCVCAVGGTGSSCADGTPVLEPDQISAFAPHAGWFDISEIHVPPDYEFGESADIAVLKLAAPLRSVRPSATNGFASPGAGTPGTLVGFGRSQHQIANTGVKRAGSAEVGSCALAGVSESTHVCWDFVPNSTPLGSSANTCPGDSGGPFFGDVGDGVTLMGVHSGGVGIECALDTDSFDTDVFVYWDWLVAQAGVDLDEGVCSEGVHVGEAGALVLPMERTANGPEAHDFEVPADIKLLRVGLNGEVGTPPNDLDLFLRQGVPPTVSVWDCASRGAGTFEFCEIQDPMPGEWHVVVDLAAGQLARYQLTITMLPEDPAPPPAGLGDWIVSNFRSDELTRVESEQGARRVVSSSLRGAGPPLAGPEGMALDRAGRLLVANPFVPGLFRIDLASGGRTAASGCADPGCAVRVGEGPDFFAPRWVAVSPGGRTLVADRGIPGIAAIVDVVPSTGDRSVLSGCADPACSQIVGEGPNLGRLLGIAFEESRESVVAADAVSLFRVDLATGDRVILSGCEDAQCSSVVGSGPSFGEPMSPVFDDQGQLYVSYGIETQTFGAIRRVDPDTGERFLVSGCEQVACLSLRGSGPPFVRPIGIALAAGGDLLVVDEGLEALVRVERVSGDRSVVSGCTDARCSQEAGDGLRLVAPIHVAVLPEPDAFPGTFAALALTTALAGARRRSGRPSA